MLSVVVPVYNTEAYLERCLQSLRDQSLHDIEVLVVDDCSPDGSRAIMDGFAKKDERFKVVVNKENKGLFGARLAGTMQAKGKYLAFLDSDDYVFPDFYRIAVERAEEGSFDVVMGDTVFVDDKGEKTVRPVHIDCTPENEYHGDEVKKCFYGQELRCYAWHTVWNKIYRKNLWDRCAPYFAKLTEHVIMTEDVAFSSLLLYEAQSFIHIHVPCVYYCANEGASTNFTPNPKKVMKNYTDIVRVFEFVERFLKEKRDDACLEHLKRGREFYCRMWHNPVMQVCGKTSEDRREIAELTNRLAPGLKTYEPDRSQNWFESIRLIFDPTMESIKTKIMDSQIEVVSFDVFDTLLLRPFTDPTDLFELMQPEMTRRTGVMQIPFPEIRRNSEIEARRRNANISEDITLDAIYETMAEFYPIPVEICQEMKAVERAYEIRFAQPRVSGVQLLMLAKSVGKRVVLISDMYLDADTITGMLRKCGITQWEKLYLSSECGMLKYSGNLYRYALEELGVSPEAVLHIGDNFDVDGVAAQRVGLKTAIQPKPVNLFFDLGRSRISLLGKQSFASFAGPKGSDCLDVRCKNALIANRFYDNAFQAMNPVTYFSGSYALAGYAAVGPHLLAVAQWVIDTIATKGFRYVAFLARDGYLVKKAVELLLPEAMREKVKLDYLVASRKTLIPALTMNPCDFYCLPINWHSYTPALTWKMLEFCARGEEKDFQRTIARNGLAWKTPFSSLFAFHQCIEVFLGKFYSKEKHEAAVATLKEYYKPLCSEDAVCFDMGYSGRLQAGISAVCGRPVPVMFVHEDAAGNCERLKKAFQFETYRFYDVVPGMSGAMREFLLSADEPGALGIVMENGKPVVRYGQNDMNRAGRYTVEVIQKNALRFVSDWKDTFAGTTVEHVNRLQFSAPFESMMRYITEEDLKMFYQIEFEDVVFAGDAQLDFARLIYEQSHQANEALKYLPVTKDGTGEKQVVYINQPSDAMSAGDTVVFHPSQVGKLKRAVGYALFDKQRLRSVLSLRLQKHPKVFVCAKKVYHCIRKG